VRLPLREGGAHCRRRGEFAETREAPITASWATVPRRSLLGVIELTSGGVEGSPCAAVRPVGAICAALRQSPSSIALIRTSRS
jgi:hypothetical protein